MVSISRIFMIGLIFMVELIDIIDQQTDISDIFEELTYQELE